MTQDQLPKLPGDGRGSDVFSALQKEIDRVFDNFHGRGAWPFASTAGDNGEVIPRMDIKETETALEVSAELPGVDEKDIDVSLTDEMLTVKGEKKSEAEREEKDLRVMERRYGTFQRSVQLPCVVKADEADAQFKHGVLKITLPKSPETAARTKKIAIKAA